MKQRPKWIRILAFNLALLGAGVLVLELVFGDWFSPNLTDRLNITRDCQRRYDASLLYDGANEIVYTRDRWGLRGAYPDLSDIDIVTMGGSATDQRYITDGKTWQDVIVREFAREGKTVSVVNAGVDGQSSFGHLKDFEWWFPMIPEFKPRYVLFYIGGNDIFTNDVGDFDDLVNHRPPTWKTHLRERSAVYRVAYTAYAVYLANRVHKLSHRKEPFGEWEWTTKTTLTDYEDIVRERLDRYRKAVAMLAEETRAIGAVPVFVTQSLAIYRKRPDGTIEGRASLDHYDDVSMNGLDNYYIIRLFWIATMEECAKAGGVCIDAAAEVGWQDGDFYDVIHNTPQGSERLGMYLHSKLRDLPVGSQDVAQ